MSYEENRAKLTSFPEGWKDFFEGIKDSEGFLSVVEKVSREASEETVYPPLENVYRAFALTPEKDVKVVIIGQDPYFNPNQANGLAFSVGKGVALPPSLVNIYKELSYEFHYPIPKRNGDLTPWAKQGVLLLNASLTVRKGEANSHSRYGWDKITDMAIEYLDKKDRPIVYLLWGSYARNKKALIDTSKHFVLEAAHPSPLARGAFFGCRHFSKTNEILEKEGLAPIDWQL